MALLRLASLQAPFPGAEGPRKPELHLGPAASGVWVQLFPTVEFRKPRSDIDIWDRGVTPWPPGAA